MQNHKFINIFPLIFWKYFLAVKKSIDNFEKDKQKRGDLVFDKISQLIFEATGIKEQAFQILKNMKSFRKKDYSSQIGDFHASIFVYFDCETDKNLFTKSELEYEDIYLNESFHIDYLCSSDKYYLNQDMNIFQQVPFNINYLGEIKDEDLQSWKNNLDTLVAELSKLHSNKIRITCFNHKNKSYIYFIKWDSF